MNKQNLTESTLDEIRRRVAEKRTQGLYPPGLEQELEREFKEILASTSRRYFASKELQEQLTEVENAIGRLSSPISTKSRFPGGSLVHRLVRKVTNRQINGLTEQIRDIESQMQRVLKMLGEFAASQEDADKRVVRELSQYILDRIAVIDHLAILTTDIESRLHQLEQR
jgi:hypothetical protein